MRLRLTLASLLIASVATAQKIIPESPTGGVYDPASSIAGDGDAASVERDAASLGFLRGWNLNYIHTETGLSGKVGGRGDAAFLAAPLPILSMLSLGVGVQSIRPPTAFDFADETKLSVALAVRPLPGLAFGATYSHLWAQTGPVHQGGGIDTLDLSASARLGRYFDLALVVHDIQGGSAGPILLQRVYEPEVAVRPTGTRLFEVGVGARFGERRGDIDPRVRLWLRPHDGIALKAEAEVRHDLYLDGSELNDVRIAIGAELDLQHIGAAVFGLFGTDAGVARGHGFTVAARLSGERYPTLWPGLMHLERIELSAHTKGARWPGSSLRLRQIARGFDRSINGVLVVVGDFPPAGTDGGWAVAEELRRALAAVRQAHKHVFVYLTTATTQSYWLASAAEHVFLDPAGDLQLTGLSHHALYFAGTGDKLGVRADFVKIAEYKSAPEQFTARQSSPEARSQREALADDLYDHVVADVADARHLSASEVARLVDHGPFTPTSALTAGIWSDSLRTDDEEVESQLSDHAAPPGAPRHRPQHPAREPMWSEPHIAVIHLDGDIVDGKSRTLPLLGLSTVGAQTIAEALTRAREDAAVRAIVLRIDSPGGSAIASERIAREVERTKRVKPVVCSLSNVAASGGYFVAAPCQEIFASPSTIT